MSGITIFVSKSECADFQCEDRRDRVGDLLNIVFVRLHYLDGIQ